MRKITFVSIFIGLILLFAMTANAITINGIATDSTGSVTDGSIGIHNAEGVYTYYIPLSGSTGIYGVSDSFTYGESSDTASAPFAAPIMDMYFHFNIASGLVGTQIDMWGNDNDLAPTNDPDHFFEKVFIHNDIINGGIAGSSYDNYNLLSAFTNVDVAPPPVNSAQNEITITFKDLNIFSGDYLFHIGVQAYDDGQLAYGPWKNTAEFIKVTMKTEPIPEPATIALLGIGLAGLAGIAARRKWKKKNVNKS